MTKDDLISRQAAIDELKNRWKKTRNYEGIGDDIAEECELYLKQVPSAQPDYDPEILRNEIQDLKLENDRLNQRNELMETYIHAIACISSKKSIFHGLCDNVSCSYYDKDRGFLGEACILGSRKLMEQEAADLIDKLEEL